jgi:acetoin utilization deacetylase AcuC-like enzyme
VLPIDISDGCEEVNPGNNVPPYTQREDGEMAGVVSMRVEAEEIIAAVRRMKPREREAFLEDLLAATSPKYLESIQEARRDYKSGRIKSHAEVFNR